MKKPEIFIVFNDKDPFLARVIKVKLRKQLGWELNITSNFDEAVELINKHDPSLLVTEILLNDDKGRSGFDLIKEIKSLGGLEHTEIVVLSELKNEDDIKLAKELGAQHYLVKSELGINDVFRKLKEIVKQL